MAEKKQTEKNAPATPPTAEPQTAGEASSKKKKINVMTLDEIEAKLAEVREKQGGLASKYARQLLARKKSLSA